MEKTLICYCFGYSEEDIIRDVIENSGTLRSSTKWLKFFLEMAAKTDADILIYGHTHKPYRKDIGGKIFINAGSVESLKTEIRGPALPW